MFFRFPQLLGYEWFVRGARILSAPHIFRDISKMVCDRLLKMFWGLLGLFPKLNRTDALKVKISFLYQAQY